MGKLLVNCCGIIYQATPEAKLIETPVTVKITLINLNKFVAKGQERMKTTNALQLIME